MEPMDNTDILTLKRQNIVEMIEQLLIDTVLSLLQDLSVKHSQKDSVICYKCDCPSRDDIPF